MSTVFNRISEYEKYSKFRFNAKGRNVIGMLVVKEWREKHQTTFGLTFTNSIEPNGIFKVYNYPEDFDEVIDSVINSYVIKCLSKRKDEKPPIKEPSAPNSISYSSDPASTPKKRTRKPIQSSPKLECSGKKLISKK